MKFWRAFVPNLCISLWLALLTLVILDQYNPMLGFLKGRRSSCFLHRLRRPALRGLPAGTPPPAAPPSPG